MLLKGEKKNLGILIIYLSKFLRKLNQHKNAFYVFTPLLLLS